MHTRRCIRSERSHRPRRLLRLGFGGDVLHGVDEVEEKVGEAACVRQDAKSTRRQFPILCDARCDVGNSPRCDAGRVYTQLS